MASICPVSKLRVFVHEPTNRYENDPTDNDALYDLHRNPPSQTFVASICPVSKLRVFVHEPMIGSFFRLAAWDFIPGVF